MLIRIPGTQDQMHACYTSGINNDRKIQIKIFYDARMKPVHLKRSRMKDMWNLDCTKFSQMHFSLTQCCL